MCLQADEFTKATAGSKLMVIADQIRYLQEQAKKVSMRMVPSSSLKSFCLLYPNLYIKVGK